MMCVVLLQIGVVGGSEMYVGAPYFAGISALRAGADLVSIFCAKSDTAAVPIKQFSPDLMVLPIIPVGQPGYTHVVEPFVRECHRWLGRLDALVIGPGLGRSDAAGEFVKQIITLARRNHLPIVLDGDALFFTRQLKSEVPGYDRAILTPNGMEFQRLWEATMPESSKLQPLSEADLKVRSTNATFSVPSWFRTLGGCGPDRGQLFRQSRWHPGWASQPTGRSVRAPARLLARCSLFVVGAYSLHRCGQARWRHHHSQGPRRRD